MASTNAKSSSADAAAKAVDDNLGTRFSTDQAQAANLYFEVDMGSKATFDELSMAVPNSPTDYARGYGVQVSNDGKSWATVATCSGTSTPEVVSFAAQTAQYVRVVLTASSTYWWSIDEFNLYSVSGAPPSITSAASVDVTPGTATSFTITSAGSPVPSLSESGTLPPGLAFHAGTNGTAVISGTPPANASGTYAVAITASNSLGSATQHLVMSVVVRVPPKQAAISLSSSPNPALAGRAVTYTARIEPALSVGSIMFMSGGTVLGGCLAVPVRSGQATCTVTYGSGGARQVTAEYLGSLGYTSSISAPDTENVTASTSTSMAVTANPASIGKPVTYVATVSPAVHVGTVRFTQNGTVVPGCAAVPVSAGRATCTITYWAGGHHMVQASYSGLNGRAASVSALFSESISFPPTGYWLATKSGGVYAAGQAAQLGSFPTSAATGPVVGMAHTPSRRGYWLVSSNGTVKAFGNAKFYGDLATAGVRASDIVAIAGTHDGHGYWLIGRDGGMFTFGDAKFHGSVPGLGRHISDIVGMVASTDGAGYLLVGSDGGVFTFGSARFFGSLPGLGRHVTDIRAILPSSSTGRGYVLVGADGGAFVFGSGVKFMGSLPGEGIRVKDIIGLALTPDGSGYYMAASNGSVFGFGTARSSPAPSGLSLPVVAISGA
ncbi:MAG TPA: Ig-like domain repeat protein [Acidimicrobiales bacterium]|nr:Ig-like domain repeat protein [Acidimicrobiales bacterium]